MSTEPMAVVSGVNVVSWKWKPFNGYRSRFESEHVNVLRRMVQRHYSRAHDFFCVTDDPTGLDPEVKVVPLWNDYADVPNPHGQHNPSCYRRLKAFSSEAANWFGKRFVSIDLDTVILKDITTLLDRPEDFIIWGDTARNTWYNGSMWMMTAGARKQVWEKFHPDTSPRESKIAGCFGSDQGWISYLLGPKEAKWGQQDGVYSYRVHIKNRPKLPPNARMIMWHGQQDPWSPRSRQLEWVKIHYR